MAKKEFLRIVVTGEKDPWYAIEYIDESGNLCHGYTSNKLETVVRFKRENFDYRPKAGDEVELKTGQKGVVTCILNAGSVYLMFPDGSGMVTDIDKVWATGHHFKYLDKLVKEMQENKHKKEKMKAGEKK